MSDPKKKQPTYLSHTSQEEEAKAWERAIERQFQQLREEVARLQNHSATITPSVEAIEAARVARQLAFAEEYPEHHPLYSADFEDVRLAVSAALAGVWSTRLGHEARPVVDLSASYTAAGLVVDEPKYGFPLYATPVDVVVTITAETVPNDAIEQNILTAASRRARELAKASHTSRISEIIFIITTSD